MFLRVSLHLFRREHQEGPSISQTSWGALALCGLLRTELPPQVPCLRVFRGPLEAPCCGHGGPPADLSRLLLDLFEKHAGEGDLLGLLPETGRGTNAMCEVLANHLLRSPSLLPCVETLASLQGASPLMPLHISRAYARRGQLEQALSSLLRCLSSYPEEACLLRQLAELLLRGGLYDQAAKAAAFAVELCPTVQRYWFSLARAQIACGNLMEALLVLNAAPAVSVTAPLYTAGLPQDIGSLPITQPRAKGYGFYSFLWITPLEPVLVPFPSRDEGHPSPAAAAAASGKPASASASSGASAAAALLRSPTFALKGDKEDSIRRSLSSCSLSFTSPLTSPISPRPPRELKASFVKGDPPPLRKQLHRGQEGGSPTHHHTGFRGALFGLARGLDEALLLRRHWELLQKEKRMHAGGGEEAGLCGSSGECPKGPVGHLEIVRHMRMLKLDLSERRRYGVLVSLYKRIGLRGLRRLVKELFLPGATRGGSPERAEEGPLDAAGTPTPTDTPRDGTPRERAAAAPAASPPSRCSSSRDPATAEKVLGGAPARSEQEEGAPIPSLSDGGGPPVGLADLAAKEGEALVNSKTQERIDDEVIPLENISPLRPLPSHNSMSGVLLPAPPASSNAAAIAAATPVTPAAVATPAAAAAAGTKAAAAGTATTPATAGKQGQRQPLRVEETLGLSKSNETASTSEQHLPQKETCRERPAIGGPLTDGAPIDGRPMEGPRGIRDDWVAPHDSVSVQDPASGNDQMLGSDKGEGRPHAVPRRLSSSLAALLAGLEEDAAFFTKTTKALPWPYLSGWGHLKGEVGPPPEGPLRDDGQFPCVKDLAVYWLFSHSASHEYSSSHASVRMKTSRLAGGRRGAGPLYEMRGPPSVLRRRSLIMNQGKGPHHHEWGGAPVQGTHLMISPRTLSLGALCERLHEWTEMEVAYRVAITQGVSPLALRGLLRLYVRLGMSVEAIRIANIAAHQFSSLCKTSTLPFLPSWLVAQLTRLTQSEGIASVLSAANSIPVLERHSAIFQFLEKQRMQLQADT
ncbi:hypothetical protein ACSSS7_005775 [Eimeria intestinalis]